MVKLAALLLACCLTILCPNAAQAKTLCTVVADATTAAILLEQGDCRTAVTPASTFKLALSVMGFDAGILSDADHPALPFKPGYADWGGENWKQPTTPQRWMKYSVVWFSQQIAATLGTERLEAYARAFGYGNADFAGDPGKNNGLERSWISSSLKISPVDQVGFLSRLVNRSLPADPRAIEMTMSIAESWQTSQGWVVSGKTGSAYPRRADESFDRARGWGWFVGWASHQGQTLVFARLIQDEQRESISGGIRARDELLQQWDELVSGLPGN